MRTKQRKRRHNAAEGVQTDSPDANASRSNIKKPATEHDLRNDNPRETTSDCKSKERIACLSPEKQSSVSVKQTNNFIDIQDSEDTMKTLGNTTISTMKEVTDNMSILEQSAEADTGNACVVVQANICDTKGSRLSVVDCVEAVVPNTNKLKPGEETLMEVVPTTANVTINKENTAKPNEESTNDSNGTTGIGCSLINQKVTNESLNGKVVKNVDIDMCKSVDGDVSEAVNDKTASVNVVSDTFSVGKADAKNSYSENCKKLNTSALNEKELNKERSVVKPKEMATLQGEQAAQNGDDCNNKAADDGKTADPVTTDIEVKENTTVDEPKSGAISVEDATQATDTQSRPSHDIEGSTDKSSSADDKTTEIVFGPNAGIEESVKDENISQYSCDSPVEKKRCLEQETIVTVEPDQSGQPDSGGFPEENLLREVGTVTEEMSNSQLLDLAWGSQFPTDSQLEVCESGDFKENHSVFTKEKSSRLPKVASGGGYTGSDVEKQCEDGSAVVCGLIQEVRQLNQLVLKTKRQMGTVYKNRLR